MFADFCTKTGIKAFSFAQAADNHLERVFWYLAILIGTGGTIYDIWVTLSTFTSGLTRTQVLLMTSDNLELEDPTLCIQYRVAEMNFGGIANSNKLTQDFLQSFNQSFMDVIAYEADKIMEDRINRYKNDTFDNLVDEYLFDENFQILMALMLSWLSSISHSQYYSTSDIQEIKDVWGYPVSKNFGSNLVLANSASNATRQLALELSRQNFNHSRAIPILGELLCNWMNVSLVTTRLGHSTSPEDKVFCGRSDINWVGAMPLEPSDADFICFQLPESLFNFSLRTDVSSIRFQRDLLYGKNHDQQLSAFLDFSPDRVMLPRSQNLLVIPIDTRQAFSVQIVSVYKRMGKCSSEHSYSGCTLDCRNQLIADACGCAPLQQYRGKIKRVCGFYDFSNDTELSSDKIPGYSDSVKCKLIRLSAKAGGDSLLNSCFTQCKSYCDFTVISYRYNDISRDTHYRNNPTNLNETYLSINVDVFSYSIIEELPFYGPKQLLSSLGGNLSLYVGASFLVLIHIFIYWIKQPLIKLSLYLGKNTRVDSRHPVDMRYELK